MIGRSGERESGISVLGPQHDDDYDDGKAQMYLVQGHNSTALSEDRTHYIRCTYVYVYTFVLIPVYMSESLHYEQNMTGFRTKAKEPSLPYYLLIA